MATHMWKRVKSGTPSARVFSAYLALVLAVAVIGPGLAVYGSEGSTPVVPPRESVVPADEVTELETVPAVEPGPVVEAPPPVEPGPAVVPEPAAVEDLVVVESSVEIAETATAVAPAAVLAPLALSSDPSGLGIVPVLVEGNPALTEGGVRMNPPFAEAAAVPGHPGMFVTVTVSSTDDGPVFSFSSDVPVVRVVAKGGNVGANVYTYEPAVYGDSSLHAPLNPSGFYAGLSHMDFYFGEIPEPEGDLKVYKFHDLDEDGVHDDGEPMLEDWEFTLTQSTPPPVDVSAIMLIDSGLTDAAGELMFSGLAPGDYTVTETLQDGWTNTTPLSQDVTVVDGQTTELWFGNIEESVPFTDGQIMVHKFHDLDEDGAYDDGEPMLEDWEFTLTQSTPPIFALSAVVLIDSGLTDAAGMLLFDELPPGDYIVTETLRDGWTNTTPLSQDVTVIEEETAHVWFGNVEIPEPEGDLKVYKFHDLDKDGVHDDGEPMLEDWEFVVAMGEFLDSGLTDAAGELMFSGLEPGDYTVTETLQDGWTNTTPLSQDVTVVDGQTAELWFGNVEEFLPFTELDLAITKTVDKSTAKPGELLTYTLTYWNTSDVVAYDFTITDDFDQRYVTVVDAAGGVVSGGKIVWTLEGPLSEADGKQTISYTARVTGTMPAGTTNVDNVVVIVHPDDSDPSNNTDRARTVVKVVRQTEPFLPFTGGEYLLLIGLAALAATAGMVLRFRQRTAA